MRNRRLDPRRLDPRDHPREAAVLCVLATIVCLAVTTVVSITVLDQAPQVDKNATGIADLRETDAATLRCLRATEPGSAARDRCLARVQSEVVPSEARPGRRGETGDTGAQGPKGDKGDTGAAGGTGPQGPQGDRGPRGSTGPGGPAGPQGAKGDKGDKGDRGEASATPPPPPPRPGGPPPRPPGPPPGRPPGPPPTVTGPTGPPGPQGEPGKTVLSVETACQTGLLGGLAPGRAFDPDGDGHFDCPPS